MLGCDVRAVVRRRRLPAEDTTGELVLAQPLPSMPVGLWGDPTGDRYRATYYETFPGRWHRRLDHVPFRRCLRDQRPLDATLNRGGVPLGTSDFYGVVEAMPEVAADSVVVHLEDDGGGSGTLVLLVACAPGASAPTTGCGGGSRASSAPNCRPGTCPT
ncbi:MAG: hypothetical protein R2713_20230 [Ilumatobacteraceae bacterium]